MTESLHIADGLELPLESITQTFAILAKRGAGKTYTASVLLEEMLGAGGQVIVIDPLDAWWGLRSSSDGESPGLPIVVFGGSHGDVVLDEKSGSAIADLMVEEQIPAVLSLRLLSKSAQRRFVAEFAERLFHRKGEDRYRQPVHLVIDEADAFVPQRVMPDTARVMGAVDDLVRRGRSSGIGVTLISQRASVVNKDVLTQLEVLVVLRTVSPQDRKAIESWIDAHDPEDQGRTVLDSLASLPVGTAWFWSPGWLELLQRVKVRTRKTFDSSSTPAIGAIQVKPATLAAVDLDRITQQLAASIEQAIQDDPKTLRRRIAELERKLKDGTGGEPKIVYMESPETIQARSEIREQGVVIDQIRKDLAADIDAFQSVLTTFRDYVTRTDSLVAAHVTNPDRKAPSQAMVKAPPQVRQTSERPRGNAEEIKLVRGARQILIELATLHPQPLTRAQIGTLAGMSSKSGSFSNNLSKLRTLGYIEDQRGAVSITDAGLAEVSGDVPLYPRSTDDLVELWSRSLVAGARKMLRVVVDRYPETMTRQELGEASELSPVSGSFSNNLSKLRVSGLIEVDRGEIRAGDILFVRQGARQ